MIDVAKIILRNNENKLLMYQRDNKPIPHANYWDLFGGLKEEYENIDECLFRELKEEGININRINYVKKLGLTEIYDVDEKTIVGYFTIYSGITDLNSNEIKLTEGQQVRYFDFRELEKLKIPRGIKEAIFKKNTFV